MNTLTSPPVATLLTDLFADADRTMREFLAEREKLSARGLGLGSAEFTAATGKAHLAITPETGRLLYILVCASRPGTIVEFGTSFGVSTVHLASRLRDAGAGRLITTELDAAKSAASRRTLRDAGLEDLVVVLQGDARHTLAAHDPGPIDMLFLDGFNHLYVDMISQLDPALTPGGLVIADNADAPGYREYLSEHSDRFTSMGFDERVEISLVHER